MSTTENNADYLITLGCSLLGHKYFKLYPGRKENNVGTNNALSKKFKLCAMLIFQQTLLSTV